MKICHKKDKVVPVLVWFSTPWRHMREWRYSSTILDLYTRWRWLHSFMPLEPVWTLWSREKSLAPARNWTLAVQPTACHYSKKVHRTFSIWEGPLLLSNNKHEVLGRTNRLLSFDMWTTQKMMCPTILLLLCVFVAMATFLLSPCLAKVEGYTYRHTDWWQGFMKYAAELRCHNIIHTKFYKHVFRYSKVNGGWGGYRDTQT
jgi:hypothetical protein